MDLAALIMRARTSRSPIEPLCRTATAVWLEVWFELDGAERHALGRVGLEAVRVTGAVPDQFRAAIGGSALAAARVGTALWWRLTAADQEAFALLGFVTLVAESILMEAHARPRPRLN
jgi:hypothetical protein